ncbi:MAG: glycosyltransferase family 39 protein [Patescibacteria group bacterium]
MDEGFTVNAVQAIQETGTEILASGFRYSCPLYCYPSALIADTFGDSPASYRILAALAGTLFIGVLFAGVKRMFNPGIALIAAGFAAFSYFQIAWSRQARWYTLFELFFWLAIFSFYAALYIRRLRWLSLSLTALFTGLAILTHELGYLLPLIFAAWTVIEAVRSKRLPIAAFVGLAAAGFAGLAGALYYLEAKISFLLPFYLNFYFRSYWVLIALAVIALIHPYNRYKRETALLLLILVAYIVPLSFLTDIVNYRYLFHATPVLFILAAVGACAILSDLPRAWQKVSAGIAIAAVFFVSGQGVLFPRVEYFLESDDPESFLLQDRNTYIFVPQPDWQEAYAFVEGVRTDADAIVTTQPPFNEIYLDEPGYWIRYSYNGKDYMKETEDDREFYVGAKIIDDVAELRALARSTTGFVLLDVYAARRVPAETRAYIETEMTEVFRKKTNSYSEVIVYRF